MWGKSLKEELRGAKLPRSQLLFERASIFFGRPLAKLEQLEQLEARGDSEGSLGSRAGALNFQLGGGTEGERWRLRTMCGNAAKNWEQDM